MSLELSTILVPFINLLIEELTILNEEGFTYLSYLPIQKYLYCQWFHFKGSIKHWEMIFVFMKNSYLIVSQASLWKLFLYNFDINFGIIKYFSLDIVFMSFYFGKHSAYQQ